MIDLRRYEKLHSIQLLKGILRKWWKVELAFADATGYVLDHAEGRLAPPNNRICEWALSSKEGFRRCNESLRNTCDETHLRRERRAVVHECHLGLQVVGCPIEFDGVPAGMLFVGGTLEEPLTAVGEEVLLKKLRELGAVPKAIADFAPAARTIPRLSPVELGQLADLLELGAREIEAYYAAERQQAPEPAATERLRFEHIIGTSPAMQSVFRLLEKIVLSDSTVLIQGESGTGKELVAKAIHQHGPRAAKPFVVQNCSAFNDNLLESALFGHAKGSFTGAVKDKKGLFEVADGGTFFLDEVGDMSPALQVKLLRVLQEGTFTPVGANETREVDVRVIAATHKDLQRMVARGEFREDLYYRIHVIKVAIPALRERIEDLDLLCDHFLHKHWKRRPDAGERRHPRLAAGALAAMRSYPWPGNVRELENEIERLIVLGGDLDELPVELLSPRVREAAPQAHDREAALQFEEAGTLRTALEQVERELIHRGLIRTHWNKSQLAKELGISRSSLIMKAERYGLDRKPEPE